MCSALAGLATGSMAIAKGEIFLLLATAASLFTIAGTVGIMFCYAGGAGGCSLTSSIGGTCGKPIGKENEDGYAPKSVDNGKLRQLHGGEQRGGDGQIEKADRQLESNGLWRMLRYACMHAARARADTTA